MTSPIRGKNPPDEPFPHNNIPNSRSESTIRSRPGPGERRTLRQRPSVSDGNVSESPPGSRILQGRVTRSPADAARSESASEAESQESLNLSSSSRSGSRIGARRNLFRSVNTSTPLPEEEEEDPTPIKDSATTQEFLAAEQEMDNTTLEALSGRVKNPELYKVTAPSVARPLAVDVTSTTDVGIMRNSNEDFSHTEEWDKGLISIVADGHGDNRSVAILASKELSKMVKEKIEAGMTVPKAFKEAIADLQMRVVLERLTGGACFVACYVDKEKHILYTATLGDSEALLIRGDKAIPVSLVRDWNHPQEQERAKDVLTSYNKIYLEAFEKQFETPPIHIGEKPRLSIMNDSINFSRSLGDVNFGRAISHDPLITRVQLLPEDTLVLASDGLWDEVTYDTVKDVVLSAPDATQALIQTAIEEGSEDNITTLVVSIK